MDLLLELGDVVVDGDDDDDDGEDDWFNKKLVLFVLLPRIDVVFIVDTLGIILITVGPII